MNKKETNYEGGADLLSDGAVKKLGKITLQAIRIESDLAEVKRVPRLSNGEREDDVQHSYSLAILAPELRIRLYPHLDNDKIQSFANAHELLEIATGDVATFDLTEAQLKEKHQREQQAKEKLMKRLTPELQQNLEEYERQDTPEARFVRAVDKILPVAMDIVGQGVRVVEEDYGVSNLEDLQKAHTDLIANFDRRFGDEFPELVQLYEHLAREFEEKYKEEKAKKPEVKLPERPSQLVEVERKFLIDLESLPFNPENFEHTTIRQGYLAVSDDGSETRIRDFGNDQRFELTVKSNGTVARKEKNIQINKEVFESLWPLTLGRRIEKTRYYIPYVDPEGDKHTIELDVYHGPSHLNGLCTAEVEFEGRETEATLRADTFQPPEWFGEDISSNPSYKNRSLASHSPHSPMNLSDISM